MLKRRRCSGLLHEAAPPLFVLYQYGRQDLEGDVTIQLDVEGTVDNPHASSADFLEDLVVRKRSPDHGCLDAAKLSSVCGMSMRKDYPPKSWIPNSLAAIRIAVRPVKTKRLAHPNQVSNALG